MSVDADSDPMSDFQSSLNDLSFNSKPLINMLTMLSEDYKSSMAPQIVKIIEKRLHSVAAEKKLPLLYLMDSICKNVGNPYSDLFTQNIVSNFCDVFEKVDEKTRLSLYKLRQTWSSIFPVRKLYAIDTRIKNKLDPAWPITAKFKPEPVNNSNSKPELKSVVKPAKPAEKPVPGQTARQQQVHINPKFLNEKVGALPTMTTGDPQSAELAKQLIQKQNELLQIQKQKLEYDVMMQKRKLEEQARALQEKEMKLKQREQQMARGNSPNAKKPKKRKRSRSQRSRSPTPPPRQKSKSPPRNQSSPRWSQSPNKRDGHRSRSPQVVKPFIPSQSPSHQPAVNPSHSSTILPTSSIAAIANQPPVPTTIPAPTILAQPEMLNMSRMDSCVVTTMSTMAPMTNAIAQNVIPTSMNNIDGPFAWSKDRDYRKELDSMIGQADEKLRAGVISVADHNVLVREMERSLRDAKNQPLNSGVNVELKEPVDTFTMPVDGKFRKLYYLDDTTAVVLLNAPHSASFDQLARCDPLNLDPRQISFEGNPTYIHIDNDRPTGESMLMDFSGQEYVHIPRGQDPSIPAIPQRIKFGGPGKEIILNGQPYPAKFNGPPIQVWFEGDRNGPHSIKLDGPTPRVKLSDQRRFDLWNQVINRAANEAQIVKSGGGAPIQPSSDINQLLSKLIAAGMIDKSQNNSPKATTASPKEESFEPEPKEYQNKFQKNVSNDPPIKLTSESLKIPRPSVVAALYKGIQCTNCSLRFDDKTSADKTKYSKHLDWHFRQNRRDKAKPNSSAASLRRNWYYPLNLWVQFKEVTDEEDTTGLFQSEDNEIEEPEAQPVSTVIAEKDETLNCCAVCGEKFDQQWNEEEEEWRLQNAVKHTDSRLYHPLCLSDFVAQSQRQAEQHLNDNVTEQEMSSANEELTKSDTKEEMSELRAELTKLENEMTETIARLSDDQNSSHNEDEAMETKEETDQKRPESDVTANDVNEETEEKPVVSASNLTEELNPEVLDDSNIKVFEMEIPINRDNQVNHDLTDIFEKNEVYDNSDHSGSETKESSVEPKVEASPEKAEKVVLQTGGIVIKMKASNLQSQPSAPPVETVETEERAKHEVIVRGKELSSLCTIQ